MRLVAAQRCHIFMPQKVLVVDDDPGILEVIKIILEDNGYEVCVLSDGKEVVKKILNFEPNIVLLDIWMSGIDGGVITKILKSNERTKTVPVVIFSASNDTERLAKEMGADDFLTKPFDIPDLVAKIKKNLR